MYSTCEKIAIVTLNTLQYVNYGSKIIGDTVAVDGQLTRIKAVLPLIIFLVNKYMYMYMYMVAMDLYSVLYACNNVHVWCS